MTPVQKFVEMPLTGRSDSDAPARFVETVLPVHTEQTQQHRRLNYFAYHATGGLWGAVPTASLRTRLRGGKALAAAFGLRYAAAGPPKEAPARRRASRLHPGPETAAPGGEYDRRVHLGRSVRDATMFP
jgi:hypothetical protein